MSATVEAIWRYPVKSLGGEAMAEATLSVGHGVAHDRRYALDSAKSKRELGWHARWTLDAGLKQTFDWFVSNKAWLAKVMTP